MSHRSNLLLFRAFVTPFIPFGLLIFCCNCDALQQDTMEISYHSYQANN